MNAADYVGRPKDDAKDELKNLGFEVLLVALAFIALTSVVFVAMLPPEERAQGS